MVILEKATEIAKSEAWELPEQYRALIEKIIRNNSRYSGNEDLFEDFCSETFKRAYKILAQGDEITNYEAYLSKVATSAILEVLKNSGRIRRLKNSYKSIITENVTQIYNTDENNNILYEIEDPAPGIEENLLNQEQTNHIRTAILELNRENPNKLFLTIFKMRYVDGKKQSEIAKELDLSQGEVSKRLIELSKKVLSRLHA